MKQPKLDHYGIEREVRDCRDLSGTDKLIFFIILSHRRSKTLRCNPGIDLIALESGRSGKTVIESIKSLETNKFVRVDRVNNRNNHYYFRDCWNKPD